MKHKAPKLIGDIMNEASVLNGADTRRWLAENTDNWHVAVKGPTKKDDTPVAHVIKRIMQEHNQLVSVAYDEGMNNLDNLRGAERGDIAASADFHGCKQYRSQKVRDAANRFSATVQWAKEKRGILIPLELKDEERGEDPADIIVGRMKDIIKYQPVLEQKPTRVSSVSM